MCEIRRSGAGSYCDYDRVLCSSPLMVDGTRQHGFVKLIDPQCELACRYHGRVDATVSAEGMQWKVALLPGYRSCVGNAITPRDFRG